MAIGNLFGIRPINDGLGQALAGRQPPPQAPQQERSNDLSNAVLGIDPQQAEAVLRELLQMIDPRVREAKAMMPQASMGVPITPITPQPLHIPLQGSPVQEQRNDIPLNIEPPTVPSTFTPVQTDEGRDSINVPFEQGDGILRSEGEDLEAINIPDRITKKEGDLFKDYNATVADLDNLPRTNEIDEKIVQEKIKEIQSGNLDFTIRVDDGKITDGHHRLEGLKRLGIKTARVDVKNSPDLQIQIPELGNIRPFERSKIEELSQGGEVSSKDMSRLRPEIDEILGQEAFRVGKASRVDNKQVSKVLNILTPDIANKEQVTRALDISDSIRSYSKNGYTRIRESQNTGEGNTKDADNIEEFLSVAPKVESKIFRGMGPFREENINPMKNKEIEGLIQNIQVGDVVDMRGISSWSSKENIANNFAGDGGIIFVNSKSNNGVELGDLTGEFVENEVLVSNKFNFKVTKDLGFVEQGKKKIKVVEVEEVPIGEE